MRLSALSNVRFMLDESKKRVSSGQAEEGSTDEGGEGQYKD